MQWLVDLMNSPNGTMVLCFAGAALVLAMFMSKKGLLGVHTKYVTLGATSREDTIKDNQMENAYLFITGLEAFISADNTKYSCFKTKWILEKIYDEVVTWIMHNHIRTDDVYVRQKSDKLRSLIYTLGVEDEFKSPEFAEQMDGWTKELIRRLVSVRSVYEQGGGLL